MILNNVIDSIFINGMISGFIDNSIVATMFLLTT